MKTAANIITTPLDWVVLEVCVEQLWQWRADELLRAKQV